MKPVAPAARLRTVALAGNPNVGKSSLFNALTGLHQRVGNYPGVTIDCSEGTHVTSSGETLRVVDLPGVVSLAGRSPDERIAVDALSGRIPAMAAPDVVVAVLDASNVRRGLLLLSQILELSIPVVVCLNMVDEATKAGNAVDGARLSAALGGLPVIETVAARGVGVERLAEAAGRARLVEGARGLWRGSLSAKAAPSADDEIAARQRWAADVVRRLELRHAVTPRNASDRLDRILLHPVLGSLIFLGVMGCMFQAVFSWATPAMDAIKDGLGWAAEAVRGALPAHAVTDLLTDGVIAGVGAVLVFLPQIVLLFLFLGILEDTGYMTRAAFLVDRPLRAVGLSGRAFIPLLSSFACAIPGIMATRTISDRRERFVTMLVAPLMTCSARLPVYSVIIAAFVPDEPLFGPVGVQGATMLALYAAGILIASLASFVLSRVLFRGEREAPILEMPPYRRPVPGVIAAKLWHRAWAFIARAGTVIFLVSVVLWTLTYLPRATPDPARSEAENASAQLSQSIAGRVGHAIEPVIRPLGFDWRVGIGILASYMAREVFVGTMGVVYAVEDPEEESSRLTDAFREARDDRTGLLLFGWPAIAALLAFYVIAPQCASTLAVIRREAGSWRWAAFVFVYLSVLAYLAALLAHRVAAALVG
jgi:ferrous iron transport protein B